MSTIRTDAEQAGAQAPAEAPKLRRFRVLCAVTRSEWYAIDAADEDDSAPGSFQRRRAGRNRRHHERHRMRHRGGAIMSDPITAAFAVTPDWMLDIRAYDGLEIQPCHTVGFCRRRQGDRRTVEPEQAQFWTVYGHCREGGVNAFEDFPDPAAARAFAGRLLTATRICGNTVFSTCRAELIPPRQVLRGLAGFLLTAWTIILPSNIPGGVGGSAPHRVEDLRAKRAPHSVLRNRSAVATRVNRQVPQARETRRSRADFFFTLPTGDEGQGAARRGRAGGNSFPKRGNIFPPGLSIIIMSTTGDERRRGARAKRAAV